MVGISPALAAKLNELEAEKHWLEAMTPPRKVELNDVAERYRALVARLDDSLKSEVKRARAAVKEILGAVRVATDEAEPTALMPTTHQRLQQAYGGDWVGSGDLHTASDTDRRPLGPAFNAFNPRLRPPAH